MFESSVTDINPGSTGVNAVVTALQKKGLVVMAMKAKHTSDPQGAYNHHHHRSASGIAKLVDGRG